MVGTNYWRWRVTRLCYLPSLLFTVDGFFGLSSLHPLSESILISSDSFANHHDVCSALKLVNRQSRDCNRSSGLARALADAVRTSSQECKRQLRYERWDCSSDSGRMKMMMKAFRETSFLVSLSSASIVLSVARACSRGDLFDCSCDENLSSRTHRDAWLWGGCGDNVPYSIRFARRFLFGGTSRNAATAAPQDLRALVDRHNANAAIKAVVDSVQLTCKCHGISGSCSTQTCWKKMANFDQLGLVLKSRYISSVRYRTNRIIHHRTNRNQLTTEERGNKSKLRHAGKQNRNRKKSATNFGTVLPVSESSLVYVHRSPKFCRPSKYSAGTKGRQCLFDVNCDVLCCGRGYNLNTRTILVPCKCRFVWCCNAICDQCETDEKTFTCK